MLEIEKQYVLENASRFLEIYSGQIIAVCKDRVRSAGYDRERVLNMGRRLAHNDSVLVGTVQEIIESLGYTIEQAKELSSRKNNGEEEKVERKTPLAMLLP